MGNEFGRHCSPDSGLGAKLRFDCGFSDTAPKSKLTKDFETWLTGSSVDFRLRLRLMAPQPLESHEAPGDGISRPEKVTWTPWVSIAQRTYQRSRLMTNTTGNTIDGEESGGLRLGVIVGSERPVEVDMDQALEQLEADCSDAMKGFSASSDATVVAEFELVDSKSDQCFGHDEYELTTVGLYRAGEGLSPTNQPLIFDLGVIQQPNDQSSKPAFVKKSTEVESVTVEVEGGTNRAGTGNGDATATAAATLPKALNKALAEIADGQEPPPPPPPDVPVKVRVQLRIISVWAPAVVPPSPEAKDKMANAKAEAAAKAARARKLKTTPAASGGGARQQGLQLLKQKSASLQKENEKPKKAAPARGPKASRTDSSNRTKEQQQQETREKIEKAKKQPKNQRRTSRLSREASKKLNIGDFKVTRSGWMHKAGDVTWNKRWFVLRGHYLMWYANEKEGKSDNIAKRKGAIDTDILISVEVNKTTNFDISLVGHGMKRVALRATSAQDAEGWARVLMSDGMQKA